MVIVEKRNKTIKFRLCCPKCGHFNVESIPIPKKEQVLEILCHCDYSLGEFFYEEITIQDKEMV